MGIFILNKGGDNIKKNPYTKKQLDHHANQKNYNSNAYKAMLDNRSRQIDLAKVEKRMGEK